MTILLTGATGFIGKAIYETNENGFRCVVRNASQYTLNDVFKVDGIHSTTNWNAAFQGGVDSVIHLAGLAHNASYTDEEFFDVNTEGTIHLASEAAKAGVKRFVFVSSIGVNGANTFGNAFDENETPKPHNSYAESKLRAEQGLQKIAKETGLEVVIIRPTLVYGANAPGNVGSLTKLIKKVPFLPFGLCKNKRSFVSVTNLASFIYTCVIHPKAAGETFLISDGESISTKAFTSAIAKGLGTSLVQLPVPITLMKLAAKVLGKSHQANQLIGDLEVDPSKASRLLGWTPPETMAQAMDKLNKQRLL
ncbi:UDP-glucose 4-epimerase [Photobacterium profundum]|uniref:UDP-N-acetyl-D-quinovosamine 4-epimerase n=1 Tax=Photobacterium profundum 3TCK TaxID=314280 RepID=Q1Z898_9GAMM|nr:NAD-dependent epimerase/dehydratase family protein [Photobacterium profundum]EAS44615.1 UDP-N-acetyl-D-quinovosamine 4-epimerase [Photobacterium profundum 3TCK]PSV57061.1 UDP-glucose 4-epimerase [Photobacterium profundum]